MLKRIWRGEISLGWAFWGVGLGGLFPLFALLFVVAGVGAIGAMVSGIKALPLPVRFFGLQFFDGSGVMFSVAGLAFIGGFTVPAIVIWRSASRSSSKLWRRIAKSYVVAGALSLVLLPPAAFTALFIAYFDSATTPEFYENTTKLQTEAAEFFKEHTGLDMPEGSKLAHVAYFREGTMDYEFGYHLILDAKDMDLKKWIAEARPFGSILVKTTPELDLEWNADGLKCDDTDRPEGKFTGPICDLAAKPRPAWQVEKRLRLDRMVTLTVIEDHNLIWLYETSW